MSMLVLLSFRDPKDSIVMLSVSFLEIQKQEGRSFASCGVTTHGTRCGTDGPITSRNWSMLSQIILAIIFRKTVRRYDGVSPIV